MSRMLYSDRERPSGNVKARNVEQGTRGKKNDRGGPPLQIPPRF